MEYSKNGNFDSKSIIDYFSKPHYGTTDYLPEIMDLLYQNSDWRKVRTQVKSIPLPKGICGRIFTKNDVAWFCKTCGKDSSCIQCQDCFENSNHIGHLVYLERSVSGCCDCGDPEAWDSKGFCCSHQGFIEESKADIKLLPDKVNIAAPIVLEQLINRYFSLFGILMIKNFITPSRTPITISLEIEAILKLLQEICDTSPIFLYIISHELTKNRTNFIDESVNFEKHILELEKPLSCIDISIEMHEHLPISFRKKMNDFYVTMLKSRDFKYELAFSFIKHYPLIVDLVLRNLEKHIESLSVQVLGMEEFSIKMFSNPECVAYLLNGIKMCLEYAKNEPHASEKILRKRIALLYIYHDFKYMCHSTSMPYILKSAFLPEFIKICAEYSFNDEIKMLTEHLEYLNKDYIMNYENELVLMKIFKHIAGSINYTDLIECKKIAKVFKECLKNLYEKSIHIKNSFYLIPVHRFFSYFITNYLFVNFSIQKSKNLKNLIMEILEIDKDFEFIQFCKQTLYPLLKTLGFFLEGFAQKWILYGISLQAIFGAYLTQKLGYAHYDFALIILLIAACENIDIEFLINSLSQNDNWLNNIFNLDKIPSEIPKDKFMSLIENFLYTFNGLMSNETINLQIIIDHFKAKYLVQPYFKDLNDILINYKETAYKKWLLHSYMSEKTMAVTYKNMLKSIPAEYKNDEKLEEISKSIFEIKENNEKENLYKINENFIKDYDPYFLVLKGRIKDSDEKANEFYKKYKISNFDPIFGYNADLNSENIWKTIQMNFIKNISNTKYAVLLGKLLQNLSNLSNNVILHILKSMKLMKNYVNPEIIIKEWVPQIKISCSKMKENLKEYIEIFVKYENEFCEQKSQITPMEDIKIEPLKTTDKMKEKQLKIMEEFKKKSAKFAIKNEENLKKLEPNIESSTICVICKESLISKNFATRPYGTLFHCTKSNVYSIYLKNLYGESFSLDGLAFYSCTHCMHYDCFIKFASKNNMILNQTFGEILLENARKNKNFCCPFCKSPFVALLPNVECIENSKFTEKSVEFVEGLIKTVGITYNKKLLEMSLQKKNEPEIEIKELSNWIYNLLKTASILDIFSVFNKRDMIRALILCIIRLWNLKCIDNERKVFILNAEKKFMADLAEICENHLLFANLLQILTQGFILCKIGEDFIDNKNAQTLLQEFHYLSIFQIIIKLLCDKNTLTQENYNEILNPINLAKFYHENKDEILKSSIDWLQNAIILYEFIFSETTDSQEKIQNKLMSLNFENMIKHSNIKLIHENFIEFKGTLIPPFQVLTKNIALFITRNPLPKIHTHLKISYSQPNMPFKFVELDDIFNDLLIKNYKRKCKSCALQQKYNALCLLCGEIICPLTTCCFNKETSEGEMYSHSQICGKGKGIYLFFHKNVIFMCNQHDCITYDSPYVDKRGISLDTSKKSFEILRLNKAKLEDLKMIFLQDKIPIVVELKKEQASLGVQIEFFQNF